MARFYYRPSHPAANERGFVAGEDLANVDDAPLALHAPIIADRIHEGARFDGVDIGSRRRRREFLKVSGLADASDFSPAYRERVQKEHEREGSRITRTAMTEAAKKLYREGKWR